MAVEIPVLCKTFEAAGDLSTKQYYHVKLDSAGRVTVPTGVTDLCIGVLQNKPDALGKAAEVMIVGISKVSADGAITLPSLIGTSADGQADAIAAGTDTTVYVTGQALEAAAAAGNIITAAINCLNPSRAA
jgi:hypothetical protein